MYGSETYNYRVHFYVNHERVKFNGGDYLETEVKSGYLNVLKPELENIKERDSDTHELRNGEHDR